MCHTPERNPRTEPQFLVKPSHTKGQSITCLGQSEQVRTPVTCCPATTAPKHVGTCANFIILPDQKNDLPSQHRYFATAFVQQPVQQILIQSTQKCNNRYTVQADVFSIFLQRFHNHQCSMHGQDFVGFTFNIHKVPDQGFSRGVPFVPGP